MQQTFINTPIGWPKVGPAIGFLKHIGCIAIKLSIFANGQSKIKLKLSGSTIAGSIHIVGSRVFSQIPSDGIIRYCISAKSRYLGRLINQAGTNGIVLIIKTDGIIEKSFIANISTAVQRKTISSAISLGS